MGLPMGANAHLQGIEDVIQANRGQTDVCERNNSTWKRHILSFGNFVKVSHSHI